MTLDASLIDALRAIPWPVIAGLLGGGALIGVLFLRLIPRHASVSPPLAHLKREIADQNAFQIELAGRLQMLTDVFASRQNDLAEVLTARVDGLSHNLGQSVAVHSQSTTGEIAKIGERLAVIDDAQATLKTLSKHVVDLSSVLGDKQTRGLFGQGRMEAIIADALPVNTYSLQATLSTGARPDCLIHLPGDAAPIAVDAKFPLEAFERYRRATSADEIKRGERGIRRDVLKHVRDIHERYLIPGETHDIALLFLPAESLHATLHETFNDVVQEAFRARVVIVSPSLLILAVQVIQSIVRDHRIDAAARTIQTELTGLIQDINGLSNAVAKLRSHQAQIGRDFDQISALTKRISQRGDRLDEAQSGGAADPSAARELDLGLHSDYARASLPNGH